MLFFCIYGRLVFLFVLIFLFCWLDTFLFINFLTLLAHYEDHWLFFDWLLLFYNQGFLFLSFFIKFWRLMSWLLLLCNRLFLFSFWFFLNFLMSFDSSFFSLLSFLPIFQTWLFIPFAGRITGTSPSNNFIEIHSLLERLFYFILFTNIMKNWEFFLLRLLRLFFCRIGKNGRIILNDLISFLGRFYNRISFLIPKFGPNCSKSSHCWKIFLPVWRFSFEWYNINISIQQRRMLFCINNYTLVFIYFDVVIRVEEFFFKV